MKRKRKSALIAAPVLAFSALLLSGCGAFDNVEWPHIYGDNEVPRDIADAPRAVESAPRPPQGTAYPLLGTVPSMPKNFSTPAAIDARKQEMDSDRTQAQAIKQNADMNPPPVPPVLPNQQP